MNEFKEYKSGSKKKKINISIIVICALAFATALFVRSHIGVSDKVVSEAALEIAEQDYGYTLELKDSEIIDSFTAEWENINGESAKAEMYLVIIDAEAKDTDGKVVETVKYAVSVIDPGKSDGYATYSGLSSAENCTGMSDSEVEELLRSSAARVR